MAFSPLVALVLLLPLVTAGPCDIYASGGTPCVAAHSTTRALFSSFSGALYQISRGSDGATTNISPLSAGGVANSAVQDSFCAGTTCVITEIFDQTGRGNSLTHAPPGGAASGTDPGGFDTQAAADGAPVLVGGHKAYGVFISPGSGYRNDATNGIAVGDAAEGLYAVFDGTHFNDACCFDYGNAEVTNTDPANGHMEAIYFGSAGGTGTGSGPWIQADLENGLFSSASRTSSPGNPSINDRFVTAVVKGQPNNWAIRGGNAQSGSLSTFYNGVRPADGYNPMSKEGAIILGIGGDNSNGAQGTFYEGVMTSGFPSDATENSVQANIVAAGYATTSLVTGPAVTVGSTVSFKATTACCTDRFIAHTGTTVNTQVVNSASTNALKLSASWNVVAGLGNSGCVSFESRDTPGSYIRHSGFELFVNANDGSAIFATDATYCPRAALNSAGTNALQSFSYPTHYFRHFNAILYAASNGGPSDFDATASFNDDVSWVVGAAFA
ncbi:glycoside hydrolase family 54 protein [Roridomyces roridus]|uniref:Alpha-L-arabinofuranosidase n=1 Tax=Roridomyces roridus TaxID=1738132 RepID=A0AAD7BZW1_9AGAR|nr:glycoside hydrolase family 54 protein [Roridomyces roridus]